jgi:hypothetical protein
MKRLLFLLLVLIPMMTNAQIIDKKKFNENALNDAVFNNVSSYITSTTFHNKDGQDVKRTAPMRCDSLSKGVISYANFDKIHVTNVKTYQDIADKCIKDWLNSFNMSDILWAKSIEVSSKYKKRTQTVTVWVISIR